MNWINFLHFYQPASSEREKIIEAVEKSYLNLIDSLKKNPQIKQTANITGCLLERINEEIKNPSLIEDLKNLVKSGQLELVGSAAYHPILPLIKKREVILQIKENERILKKFFGNDLKLKGFFLPEMSYSPEVAKLIKKLKYEWLILDEISAYGKLNTINNESNYFDLYSGLQLIFRNRQFSQGYIPDTLLKILPLPENKNLTVITATDAELYGLRHIDTVNQLDAILTANDLITDTISAYIEKSKSKPVLKIDPLPSSWETTEQEIIDGQPFNLWDDQKNNLHKKLWKLGKLSQNLYFKYQKDINAEWSHWHLVRGLASCTFWWASGKDLSHVYGPVAWNPDEVEKGTLEMIKSIRSLEKSTTLKEKLKGESFYYDVKKSIWEKHWRLFHEKSDNKITANNS